MVAKLIAIDGPEKGLELILEKGDNWVIGRDPKDCDFVLDDPKVSRRHATIRKENGKYFIKNISRTNPVSIGDESVKGEKELNFDEVIKVGETHFRFSEIKTPKDQESSEFDQLFEDLDEPPVSLPAQSNGNGTDQEKDDDNYYDTIFQDVGDDDTYGDLSENYVSSERFVLKVLAGPNSGAEFAMQKGRSYIIGTDVTGCDVIFNDLSVSRHHARISITEEEEIIIEDLDSRNGVLVDDELTKGQKVITPKNIVSLGTTKFIVVDREAAEDTVITKAPQLEESEEPIEEPFEEPQEPIEEKKGPLKALVNESTFIFTGILIAAILILGTGAIFLFRTSPVQKFHKDHTRNISNALGDEFPDVRFTYNSSNGEIFVVGHVLTSTQREELLYKLNNLSYITNILDDVVVDEYVTQEMNLILNRNSDWLSISMQAPKPGQFVLTGYLPSREDNAQLSDYMNIQFPYIDRLTNYVVVEQDLYQEIASKLYNYGFYNVNIELSNGDVTLGGYVGEDYQNAFTKSVSEIKKILGVRKVNNFVVYVAKKPPKERMPKVKIKNKIKGAGARRIPFGERLDHLLHDPSIVNLTNYLGLRNAPKLTYSVTGFAEQKNSIKAVEINGKILVKGDIFDGMRVLDFQGNFVFLEKNGLKYKIECIK